MVDVAQARPSPKGTLDTEWLWPLCGRLGESPGAWRHGQPCPRSAGEIAARNGDFPVHNGYGPRTFTDSSRPMSFHRGLDLATRAATGAAGLPGNPVFAVCDGWISEHYGTDPDSTLLLKCPTSGSQACSASNPCVTAAYRHIQLVSVAPGSAVSRGQHLGYSGSAASRNFVFPHLHFEVLDPRHRPSSRDGGWLAFSKDSINPLRHLPLAATTSNAFPVTVELATGHFDAYPSASGVVSLRVGARPGYAMDFESIEIVVYRLAGDGRSWEPVSKDAAAIAAESGTATFEEFDPTLGIVYPIADGRLDVSRWDPERFSGWYSPFSNNSSLWTAERTLTYYRLIGGGTHPGLDGFLERNASGRMLDGHLVFDFDFKLIEPFPNPDVALERWTQDWWGMHLGFRGYPDLDGAQLCVAATVRLATPANAPTREHRFFVSDQPPLPCDGSFLGDGLFTHGFELGDP